MPYSQQPDGEMKTAKLSDLVVQLGQRSAPPAAPDADLLNQFLAERDEAAFALLVRRHGALVLGVCRRVTGDHHLAEDAFQAVFVVLATKAGSVWPQSALPAWLCGVAHRVALRARTMRDRRRRHEAPVETLPERASPVADGAEGADLAAVLDEEIARLPEYQRVPVVVCELEGRSRQEAAAQLGISEGTLSSRLARARKALAARLRRRGIAPSAAGLTAAFAQLASGGVPNELVGKAVTCALAPGPIPAAVAALSHEVLRVMFIQKLKVLTLALVVASGLLASAAVAAERLTAADRPADPPPPVGFTEPVPSRTDQPPPKPPAGAQPLPQGPNKLLFFRSQGLVLIDPDGKNEKKLTENRETSCGEARLSPDGKKIAVLVRSGEGEAQTQKLFVRALDEKEPGTDLGVGCDTFVWSPDGSEIACAEFSVGVGPGTFSSGHFVIDVKTKKKQPLKLPADHLLSDWSADGKFFLTTRFVEDKEKPEARQARLYLMNRDGTEHKALSDEKQFCLVGRLSPDGKRVLHGLVTWPKDNKAGPKVQLAVLDSATGKSTAVGDTPLTGEILGYCWSPDGTRIAYHWRELPEGKEPQSHLVVCDPSGKNAKTIASEKGRTPVRLMFPGRLDWR